MGADVLEEKSLADVLEESGGTWSYNRASDGGEFFIELKKRAYEEQAELDGRDTGSDDIYAGDPPDLITIVGENAKYREARDAGKNAPRRQGELPAAFKIIVDALTGETLGVFAREFVGQDRQPRLHKIEGVSPRALEELVEETLKKGLSGNAIHTLLRNEEKATRADGKAVELEAQAAKFRAEAEQLRAELGGVVAQLRTRFEASGVELEDVVRVQIGEGAAENLPK